MSDYKELIAKLRFYADTADDPIYGICINSPKVMLHAADVIEQLVKERDAAMADLKGLHDALEGRGLCCYACKNDVFDYDKSVCAGCALQDNWEWRGVQEDNDGKID